MGTVLVGAELDQGSFLESFAEVNGSQGWQGPGKEKSSSSQLTSSARVGAHGCQRRGMPASAGVRLPLRSLQEAWAATAFSQSVLPPRDLGWTWSIVSALGRPP